MPRHSLVFHRPRGSIMLVAMIFAVAIAISLASYIQLARNSLKQASRSFYANSAMNVAEIGLEQAIACFNQIDTTPANPALAWPVGTWKLDATPYDKSKAPFSPSAVATFSGLDVGPGAKGSVKVYVQHYEGSAKENPIVVAKATVTQVEGPAIEKYIELTLKKRSLFAPGGLVARGDITGSGSWDAVSWNSDPDDDPTTAAVPWPGPETANIVVGSAKGDIELSNGTVKGYVKVSPGHSIDGGTVKGLTGGDDPDRRSYDFDATFPDTDVPPARNPTYVDALVKTSTSFGEGTGDDYYIEKDGTKTYYYVFRGSAAIDLTGSNQLKVNGNCVFLMTSYADSPRVDAITVNGNQGFQIQPNSSLKIYTNGDVDLSGGAYLNDNASPATFMIFGTNPTFQTITIAGTADIKAVIYAPHAKVSLDGTISIQGAVVGDTIDLKGTPMVIYDDDLKDLTAGNPFGIQKWRELTTATERAAYATPLNF